MVTLYISAHLRTDHHSPTLLGSPILPICIQYVQQNPSNSGLTGWKPVCVSHDSEAGSSRAARVALHHEDVQASRSP